MRLKVLTITDVAERHLCCGCGACAAVAPGAIEMVDDLDQGRRPIVHTPEDPRAVDAMKVCPGIGLEHDAELANIPGVNAELLPGWGPILEMWEGHAADDAIHHAGSSGGAASAIALHCLENESMHGVVHTAARTDAPYLNETVLSTTRDELLARTGSRYAPASPCDGLGLIEHAPAPCVFIGKPCDVAAARKARRLRPELDEKLGVTIAFFCAGTPTTQGTFEMLERMGVDDPASLVSLRYRGDGWPGLTTAIGRTADGGQETRTLTYEQSWGEVLTNHKQWRCKICPDHTGEFADIAVGDPWYREVEKGAIGSSLILARTPRGREIVRSAIESGALIATPVESWKLPASQKGLLKTRGAVWGRLLGSKLIGMPTPRYVRLPMFRFWLKELGLKEKAQSIVGTIRRVVRSELYRRVFFDQSHVVSPAKGSLADSSTAADGAQEGDGEAHCAIQKV